MTTSTTLVVRMKKRSNMPRLPLFGRRLRELRGDATRQEISNRLNGLNAPLTGSTLAQYEDGAVWAPDPAVLWGLSRIYKVPFEDLVVLLRAARAVATGLNPDGASNDELKSDVTNTLGSDKHTSLIDDESARHVPSAARYASGGARRSRSSLPGAETEHRFEAIATRLENITETLAAFGRTLATTVAQQQQAKPRGKAASAEGASPRRRSSDR